MVEASRVLTGRAAERAALGRLLESASTGVGVVGCLEGVAGIGKTALLRAAVDQGRDRGFTVLTARASVMEREFAYGVVRQLFGPQLTGASETERAELLSGAASLVAAVLDDDVSGVPSLPAAVPSSHANMHGLYWLAANVAARGPVLIAVDDVQWVDLPSLRWLVYLARKLESLGVALLLAHNPGETATDTALVTELIRAGLLVSVGPLDERSVTVVAERAFRQTVDKEYAAACWTSTGGNPLFLAELLRGLTAAGASPSAASAAAIPEFGPSALAHNVTARLVRHSAEVIATARAIAVLEEAELSMVAALAELDPSAVANSAQVLADMGFLAPVPPMGFVHALVRGAILYELNNVDRYTLHAKAAELLWRAEVRSERVAGHLLTANTIGEPWAVEVLRIAAAEAVRKGAAEAAVAYLRRALREPMEEGIGYQVTAELGLAELHVDLPAAVGHVTEALERVEDVRAVARMGGGLAWVLYQADRGTDAVRILNRAVARIEPVSPETARELQVSLVAAATTVGGPDATPLRRELIAKLSTHQFARPSTGRLLALLAGMWQAWEGKDADEVQRVMRDAVTEGAASDIAESPIPAIAMAIALCSVEDNQLAYQACSEAMDEAGRRGLQSSYATMIGYRARAARGLGRLTDARDDAQAALDVLDGLGMSHHGGTGTNAIYVLADALIELGQLEAADKLLAKSGLLGELPSNPAYYPMLYVRGRIREEQGDIEGGLAEYLTCGRRMLDWGMVISTTPWQSRAALAYAALGNPVQARRLAEDNLAIARSWGRPIRLGVALHTSAMMVEGAERITLLQEAQAALESGAAPVERARTLIDLGVTLNAEARQSEARQHLREATILAERCGAVPLFKRAHDELGAAGARSSMPPAVSKIPALTARESRIATLVVAGRTNREIAQEFFVTQRAVELRLSSIYRKLNITRRAQLSTALSATLVREG